VDVGKILIETGADVLCNFLPAGSHHATRYYADQAIKVAKIGFVNGMPEYIAKDPEYRKAAEENNVPIIGDDVKSQLGGTILHRAFVDCLVSRGITISKTYQLNYAGNTDFKNMAFGPRGQLKHESKAAGISAFLPETSSCSVAGAIVENMGDRKSTVFHFEGVNYGGAPLSLKAYLEVEDSPNFAGTIAEAVRYAKIARDRGIGGVLEAPSAFLMKNPVKQINDKEAVEMLKQFVAGTPSA
jgi:myo-inositol-1-phosphate synthase